MMFIVSKCLSLSQDRVDVEIRYFHIHLRESYNRYKQTVEQPNFK